MSDEQVLYELLQGKEFLCSQLVRGTKLAPEVAEPHRVQEMPWVGVLPCRLPDLLIELRSGEKSQNDSLQLLKAPRLLRLLGRRLRVPSAGRASVR